MKKLLITALIAISLSSCSTSTSEPYCYTRTGAGAINVSGPETGTVNQALTFLVSYKVFSPCGTSDGFIESTGFPKKITAAVAYEGCNCATTERVETGNYTFTAAAAGTYVLQFTTDNVNAPIVKTVTISQ